MQKQNLWLAILFSTGLFDINCVGNNNVVIQFAAVRYSSNLAQSVGQHATHSATTKPWNTHSICHIPNDFN